jgi:hypothetical protein
MKQRLDTLEAPHREWVADLVDQLGSAPELQEALISSRDGSFVGRDLIEWRLWPFPVSALHGA